LLLRRLLLSAAADAQERDRAGGSNQEAEHPAHI
jgi:hypothetical protein